VVELRYSAQASPGAPAAVSDWLAAYGGYRANALPGASRHAIYMLNSMTRREQQARRAERRARDELESALSGHVGEYTPPPRSECRSKNWYDAVDDADTIRIRVWTWRKGAVMVDFAIAVEVLDIDQWGVVARVDCAHGNCHLHPPHDIKAREVLCWLRDVGDLRDAFQVAYDRLERIALMIRDGGHRESS
jgi:hypothetical protein